MRTLDLYDRSRVLGWVNVYGTPLSLKLLVSALFGRMVRIRIVKQSEKRETTIPWRKVHGNPSMKFKVNLQYSGTIILSNTSYINCLNLFQVAAPPISYGMRKKLEPVLKMPTTQRHATRFLQAAAALTNSGLQDEDRKTNKPKSVSSCSDKADVFIFPSSPKKDVKENHNTVKINKKNGKVWLYNSTINF